MSEPTASLSSSAAVPAFASRASAWLWRTVVFLLLTVSFVRFPRDAETGLDPSWRMALNHFLADGTAFGTRAVFTYGPLGLFMGHTYTGEFFALHLVWQFVASGAIAWAVFALGRPLALGGRVVLGGFFLCYATQYVDFLYIAGIAAFAVLLIRDAAEQRPWQTAACAALLGLFMTVKFTHIMLGGVGLAAAFALDWHAGRRRRAWTVLGTAAGTFLLIWIAAGQSPFAIPSYLLNSWQISQGYEDAMFLDEPAAMFAAGAWTVALLAAYGALAWFTRTDTPRTLALGAVVAAGTYLNWKHGFVRADGHVFGFFLWAAFVVVAFPALLADGDRWRWAKRLVLLGALGCAIWGTVQIFQFSVIGGVEMGARDIREKIARLARLPELHAEYDARLAAITEKAALPRVRAAVGKDAVDLIGHDQAFVLLNKLNYTPRPVFQSYSAYTPRLAELNAKFLASARAPQWLLHRVGSLDERPAMLDEAPLLRELLVRYEYAFTERDLLVWRRRTDPLAAAPTPPEPVREGRVKFGDAVDLSDLAGRSVWLEVDWGWSLRGRLRRLLYKTPELRLEVTDANGVKRSHRLPQLLAHGGFLVSPVVTNNTTFLDYALGQTLPAAQSVAFTVAPDHRAYFGSDVRFKLSVVPTPGKEQAAAGVPRSARFPLLAATPKSIKGPQPPAEVEIDGVGGVVVHAPSEMVFDVPAGRTRLMARFAFPRGAYTDGNRTDGAVFSAIARGADGREQELFSRRLDPLNNPADQGWQELEVELPAPAPAEVILRAGVGPNNSDAWDWTAWSGVGFR